MANLKMTRSVTEPYENVYIGNFLYGLGLAIGRQSHGRAVHACVNLLQQGPMDGLLGDVLLEFPGTLRLLEFKRSQNKSTKELDKVGLIRAAISESPALLTVSRAIHWYVESIDDPDAAETRIHVSCYIDLGTKKAPERIHLAQFVDDLAIEALNPSLRINPSLIKQYLKCVGDWNKAGSVSTGGMLVHIDTTGALRYVPLDDIRELLLQHREYCELRMRVPGDQVQERELERTRKDEIGLGHSRGWSR